MPPMQAEFVPLAQTTLRDPRAAAQRIMAWRFERDVLWTALALVAILNTGLVLLVLQIAQPVMPIPGYFSSPLTLFVLLAGLLVVYVHAMYWSGLSIGGQGALNDILALVIWFQVLRAMAQIALLVLGLALPGLGSLFSIVVAVWGFWIFLNFITAAMHLPSVGHAIIVIVIAAVGLILGMGVLVALIGLVAQGVSG